MSDESSLLYDLDHGQWMTLRALADLAEERGDVALARGYRELANHERWPIFVNDWWEWWRGYGGNRTYSCSLPRKLYDRIREVTQTEKGQSPRFDTASAAIRCAAVCIGELTWKQERLFTPARDAFKLVVREE